MYKQSRADLDPMIVKSRYEDWDQTGCIQIMRQYSRLWISFGIKFLNTAYSQSFGEIKTWCASVIDFWQKICNKIAMTTATSSSGGQYDIVSYELFIIIKHICQYQNCITYSEYKQIFTTFAMNFKMYDINDSDYKGKIAWCQEAMIAAIKSAERPGKLLAILNQNLSWV